MFKLHHIGDVAEIRVSGEWPREEYLRACAEVVADIPSLSGVIFDLRDMTNAPAPGRGSVLADEIPRLLPRQRVAFVVRPDTALYGVVRQITMLTKGDLKLFDDRDAALEWLTPHESI